MTIQVSQACAAADQRASQETTSPPLRRLVIHRLYLVGDIAGWSEDCRENQFIFQFLADIVTLFYQITFGRTLTFLLPPFWMQAYYLHSLSTFHNVLCTNDSSPYLVDDDTLLVLPFPVSITQTSLSHG